MNFENGSTVIPVRSERQAMDWSLVLASQDIPTTIERSPENRWALIVRPGDYGRAVRTLRQYHIENRAWGWRQHLPGTDITLHWGAALWCFLLIFVYRAGAVEFPGIQAVGRINNVAVAGGQWWRLFTAMLLHADLSHLLANVTTGVLFLGLAMARFGPGCGLLASYLAGVAGNVAGLLIYRGPYQGLGASGMVMGALGLISIQSISSWRSSRHEAKQWIRAAFSGMMLFVLFGTDPTSDVIAHLGGFAAGAGIGGAMMLVPPERWQNQILQWSCSFLLAVIVTLTACLALWKH